MGVRGDGTSDGTPTTILPGPAPGALPDPASGDTEPPSSWRALRWVFHAVLVMASLALLGTMSAPGTPGLTVAAEEAVLLGGAVGWLIWLVSATVRRSWSRWLLVAPVGGLVVLGLVWTGAPFAARWALSRDAFAEQAAAVQRMPPGERAGTAPDHVPVPSFIGLYSVTDAERLPDGAVLFREAHGAGFTADGGFAYLPSGMPSAYATGHRIGYRHLDGPWYVWTDDSSS